MKQNRSKKTRAVTESARTCAPYVLRIDQSVSGLWGSVVQSRERQVRPGGWRTNNKQVSQSASELASHRKGSRD